VARVALGVLALVLIAVLALTSRGGRPAGTPSPRTAPTLSASSLTPFGEAAPASASFVRTCATSVAGSLDMRGWRPSVHAGPFAVAWLREAGSLLPPALGRRRHGYRAWRYLVVVKQGHDVTISVPIAEQDRVALLYNPAGSGRSLRLEAGDVAVNFRACPGTSTRWKDGTQFNGGLLVGGAHCLVLDVRDATSGRRWHVVAPFGRHTCPA